MAYDEAVLSADDLRRRGEVSWEEYAALLKGKFSGDLLKDIATRKRDRNGRLRELEDLGGRE
jgi:hypothetical protein